MRRKKRELGFWMSIALIVGNMVGSGVFLLPASLAPFGVNSITGWGVTVSGAFLLAIVFAQLSRGFPSTGGPYIYTRAAFGELTAFMVAWGYWVSVWAGNAAIATGTVSYLNSAFPGIGDTPRAAAAVTLGMLWSVTLVNCLGVRTAGWVQSTTTVLKILPLIAVIALGMLTVRHASFANLTAVPLSFGSTAAAATLTLWAMLGLESATVPAGKIADAGVTVPRATLIGTATTAIVCAAACSLVMLMVPGSRLATSQAPFADAVRGVWGVGSADVLALFAVISGVGALNGWVLLQGELPFAMARAGNFPKAFGRESARGTPTFSIVVTSLLVSFLVLANYQRSIVEVFTFMILISTSASLVMYLVCSAALLELVRRKEMPLVGRRTAATVAVAALATAYALWAIAGAGGSALGWSLLLLALGLPIYVLMRTGVLQTSRVPDTSLRP